MVQLGELGIVGDRVVGRGLVSAEASVAANYDKVLVAEQVHADELALCQKRDD